MTVSPTSYEALVVDYAAAMLAGSTTFQALVGVASAVLARPFIVETENGSAKAKPYALVHTEAFKSEYLGHGVYGRSGEVIAIIHTTNTNGDTDPEVHRRLRNTGGAIRSEMMALQGGSGYLAHVDIDVDGPVRRDESGADRGTGQILLTIRWSSP